MSLSRRGKWLIALSLAFVFCVFLWRMHLSSWHPWPGLFIAILGLLGVLVPLLKDPLSSREKAVWAAVLVTLAIAEIRSLKLASDDFEKDRKAANDSFASLLAKEAETMATITGGDSWAYVDLLLDLEIANRPPPRIVPRFIIRGRHPLRHVQLRVVDYRNARELFASNPRITPLEIVASPYAKITELGDTPVTVPPAILFFPIGIDTSPDNDKHYFIEIRAMNGAWREYLQYRKINGQWEHAIKVVEFGGECHGGTNEGKLLLSQISDGFPKVNGEVDWLDQIVGVPPLSQTGTSP
jgi:hypothetical protein